jgi:hypothetical protein
MKMKAHSTTGFFVKDLQCLKVREAASPNRIPMLSERKERMKKSPPITATDDPVKASPDLAKEITALNRMIVTASFTTPSPRTTLNSLGYFLALIMATAAITSVEQIKAHMTKISEIKRVTGSAIHVSVSFW